MQLDADTLNQIIRNHIKETINCHVNQHALGVETGSSGQGARLRDTLDSLDIMIAQARHHLEQGNHYHVMTEPMKRIVHKLGLNLDPDNPGPNEKLLAFHLCQADITAMEQAKRVLNGKTSSVPKETETSQIPAPAPEKGTTSAAADSKPSITLQELIDRYSKHQITTDSWRPGTIRNMAPILNALLSYFKPETPISTITVDRVQSYLDILWALPPRYTLLKQYKGVALYELDPKQLMKDHDQHLDQTTVRGYMLVAQALFKYAEDLDWVGKSPVRSALVPSKKKEHAREQRDAYTLDQLNAIFNPDTLLPWVNYRGFKPARLWVPVLALCSTGRLEEICGLRAMDVKRTPEGVTLDIEFHDERKIKNANSIRVVPVVEVISGQLLKYAESLPEASRLFPQLAVANNKLSHNFGKQWGRYVRKKIGIENPKIAPMHSLRHFLIDRLYKALVPPQVIKALDGHAPGHGETGGRYAKGLEVGTLREHCLPVIEETLDGVLRPLINAL